MRQRVANPLRKAARVATNLAEYRQRQTVARPDLSPELARCAESLLADGYTRFPGTAAPVDAMIAAATQLHADYKLGEASGKRFFRNLCNDDALAKHPSLLATALDPAVIDTITGAFGHLPYLESIELLLTLPDSGPLTQSQFLHYDRVDTWAIKQFIYIYDVDEDCGPFTLMPKPFSARVPATLPHYVADEAMERHVSLDNLVVLEGNAGSRMLIDVRGCFHYGSRSRKPRLAFVAYYNTGFGYYPRMRSWRGPIADNAALTAQQRQVLGL